MTSSSYEYLIDIVTKRYFHGVDNKDIALTLACFQQDAVLMEAVSGNRFVGRDTGIRSMFERLFAANDRLWHGNFVHVADPSAESICSQFSVEVEPSGTGRTVRYENANRFYLEDGLFKNVYVYMSGENLLK